MSGFHPPATADRAAKLPPAPRVNGRVTPAPADADPPRVGRVADAATRVAVLANPFSGTGPNRDRVRELVEALAAEGFDAAVCWTPAERKDVLSDPGALRCAVVAGGDGSIADAVNEMHEVDRLHETPLGVLPLGNENLFADEFGFGREPASLVERVKDGRWRRIDLGRVGDRLFTLMASAGLDAEVVRRMEIWRDRGPAPDGKPRLRRVGRLSYALRMLGSLRDYPYPPITLEADGERVTGSHAFVFNLPRYGGGLRIAPDAEVDDGLLDWIVFRRRGMLSLLRYALLVFAGRHLAVGGVSHGRAARVSLHAEREVPVQADGDPAGQTPASVEVRRASLRVLGAV